MSAKSEWLTLYRPEIVLEQIRRFEEFDGLPTTRMIIPFSKDKKTLVQKLKTGLLEVHETVPKAVLKLA